MVFVLTNNNPNSSKYGSAEVCALCGVGFPTQRSSHGGCRALREGGAGGYPASRATAGRAARRAVLNPVVGVPEPGVGGVLRRGDPPWWQCARRHSRLSHVVGWRHLRGLPWRLHACWIVTGIHETEHIHLPRAPMLQLQQLAIGFRYSSSSAAAAAAAS